VHQLRGGPRELGREVAVMVAAFDVRLIARAASTTLSASTMREIGIEEPCW
jgi:hypothetical protein